MRIFKSIILSAVMLMSLAVSAQQKTIHVLAVNDMHAFLDRASAFGGVIDSLRALYPEMLVFSSGDNRTGNPVNDQYDETNRPMMEVMNAFGINASAVGNHEFDGKIPAFKKNMEVAQFPFLCSNISVPDSMGFKLDPYKIFEVNGVKIGVVSILQVNSRGIPDCLADNVKGLSFSDPKAAAIKYGDIVRKQCDIEILLSHIGYDEDTIYAKEIGTYDAILGGHSHSYVPANTIYNNVLITQSTNKMRYCTLVTFVVEDGKVVSKSSKLISILETQLRDTKIADLVKGFNKNPFLQQVVGNFKKPIKNIDEMGALVTDGQRYGSKAQITVQNHGGVRYDTHDAGEFSMKDALMLDPFGNKMMLFKLKGSDVKRIITEAFTNDEYRVPFVSGVTYELTVDKKTLKPLALKVFNEKGKEIKDRKLYKVSCNNYVVSISFLKDYDGKLMDKTSCDCLIEYLKDKGPVDYSGVIKYKYIEK